MAIGLAARFATAAAQFWGKKLTVGSAITVGAATTAVPIAVAVADHESNGALSYGTLEATVAGMKKMAEGGASPETIEKAMDSASYIVDVSKTFNKGLQNFYVASRMQDKEGADAILTGKRAALEFMLLPDKVTSTTAKHFIRKEIADSMFKDDRNAADKHIANKLIDGIVRDAQVIPLNGNQVTRDDIKNSLLHAMQNPDQNSVAAAFLKRESRVMNGLRQIWPEFAVNSQEIASEKKKKEGLSGAFENAANGDNALLKIFLLVMQMLMQAMGMNTGANPRTMPQRPISRAHRWRRPRCAHNFDYKKGSVRPFFLSSGRKARVYHGERLNA